MTSVPDLPGWVPLEQYGVGIPFLLLGMGLALLTSVVPGVQTMSSLTMYGRVGLVTISVFGLLFVALAGFTYSKIDHTWWLKTRDEDE